jgi:drug/metabolite transporter (DMT)-like permease
MSTKQWASILVFAAGVVIVTTSLFLETLGEYTGFWLVTGAGFTVIAASVVLDGHVGASNPEITQRPVPPSQIVPDICRIRRFVPEKRAQK